MDLLCNGCKKLIAGAWWLITRLSRAVWAHPVLRTVLLLLLGAWWLWWFWWPISVALGSRVEGQAIVIVILSWIWWLLLSDSLAQHFSPGIRRWTRLGYGFLAFPAVAAALGLGGWAPWVLLSLLVVGGIVIYFTSLRMTSSSPGGPPDRLSS